MLTQGKSIPVGAVLPYSGVLSNAQLMKIGWAICNGAQLANATYPDLYAAVGTANGGDGITCFNLPDYQGRFLRGVDETGNIDKGAASRRSMASGGSTGARVGSIQGYSTANGTTPFVASINNIPDDDHRAYSGSNADMLVDGGPSAFTSSSGGDKETRPINAYINFIIKVVSTAAIPVGTIINYAGAAQSTVPAQYSFCDGSSLMESQYQDLFLAISNLHGGSGANFNLPDYRGRFLRGADNGTGRDPDTLTRTAMATNGAAGDSVGSVQNYATAPPVVPFAISIGIGNDKKTSDHCDGHDNSAWNKDAVSQSFTAGGGDKETRPVNVYLDHYILNSPDPNTGDICPVGTIIAFPGNGTPPNSQWLICEGSSLPVMSVFQALFNAIGTQFGGDSRNFNVPDLRGQFIRGADHGAKRDPDAATRTSQVPGSGSTGSNVGSFQGFASAKPISGDIMGAIAHLPTTDSDNAAAILCSTVANWNGGAQSIAVSGGDAESRPINANTFFYIKYALSA